MIEVKDGKIRIEGHFERTYMEMVRILTAYREYLHKERHETMISDRFINELIWRALNEKA